jgi:autotransporter-associated beta strand protein
MAFTGAANTFGNGSAAGQTFLQIDQATVQVGNGGTTGMIGSGANASVMGDIQNDGVLAFALTSTNRTLSNIIKGNGSVSNVSTGTITLTGNNTYSGTTSVSAGKLALSGSGSLGTSSIQITGGELDMGGKSLSNTLTSLAGGTLSNGTITNNGGNYALQSGTVSAVLAGTNGLNKTGTGVLTLTGNTTYNGATTINAGTLFANGNIANSAVTINSGATLGGSGTIATGVVVNSGATIAPGATSANNAFGNLSVDTLTLNGGGNYSVKIGQASGGTAGTNWDLITVGGGSGGVTINAASNNTFGIKLFGSTMTSFNSSQSYSWNIIDWGSATGFDASKFSIDTTNFGQIATGTFTLANTDGYLKLSYGAGAAAPNWTGGSGDWSTGFGTTPSTGSPLEFSGASSGVATNNIANGSLSSVLGITFSSGAGAFTLNATSGSAGFDSSTPLGVTGAIVNSSNNTQTIDLALSYGSSQAVRALSGNIVLNGALITSNSSTATFEGDNSKIINGNISGTGGIAQSGNGSMTLNAQNSYTGTTAINSGTLQLLGSANLGNGNYSGTISNNGTFVVNTTENQILSGPISGSGALVKSNAGNLTLRGVNNYSGNTTINAGSVFLEDDGLLGSASYSGNVLNNGVLEFKGTASQSLNGIISGSGGVTFNGTGETTLASNNTYLGGTVINSGTVSVATLGNGSATGSLGSSSSAASNLVISGGTLVLSGASASSNRSFTLVNNTTSTVSVDSSSANMTLSGNSASTSGSLVKEGFGQLILSGSNTYTGTTSIARGTLTLNGSAALGGGNYAANIVNSGTLKVDGNQTLSGTISGIGGLQKNNAGILVLNGNNSYSGTTTLSAGTIQIGNSNAFGTGSLQFSGSVAFMSSDGNSRIISNSFASPSSSNMTITFGSVATQTGGLTFSGSLSLNGAVKTFNILNATTFTGVISNANSWLTKNGSGTLVLSGNNTYGTLGSTVTTLNSGTLQIGSNSVGSVGNITSSAIGKGGLTLNAGKISSDSSTSRTLLNAVTFGGNVTIGDATNNGTLTFSAAADLGGATRILTVDSGATFGGVLSNGSITKAGSGVLTLNGANTYAGGTQINAGTVVLGHADGLGSTGTIAFGGGTLQYGSGITTDLSSRFSNSASQQYAVDTNGNNITFATGLTSSGGSLTKSGLGTLTLGGSNTFDGSTTISAGNLSISSAVALASTSGINLGDTAALIYTGATASFDRNISVTSGTGTIRNTGSGLLTLTGSLTKNGTTLTLAGGSNGITVSGAIGGSAANSDLIIDGGSVTLASANSYNGPTAIINGATLTASVTNALPTANGRSAISIDSTGSGSSTLALGSNQSVASLTGAVSSNVTLGSNTLTIGTTSGSATYAGRITGGGSSVLVKDGASTQVLSGDNSGFTGSTTINSGTLTAAAAGAMGDTTVIDVNGGSFLVTAENAVSDDTNINLNGGRMAISGNFNENVGALTLSANSTIDFAGFSGVLRFSGIGSWAANTTLSVWNWSGTTYWGTQVNNYANPSNLVFTSNSDLSSNLANISFYSDSGNSFVGSGFEVSGFSGGGSEIIAVPEPETWLAAALLTAAAAYKAIRRRPEREPLEGHRPA